MKNIYFLEKEKKRKKEKKSTEKTTIKKIINDNNKENNKIFSNDNNLPNNNNDNSGEPNQNQNYKNINSNINIDYINKQLYPLTRNHKNINPLNVNIINIIGDSNCLFRAISYFITRSQYNHLNIRNNIYLHASNRINLYPNIYIDTENVKKRIHDYISTINMPNTYGGDIEILISYELYNFNIAI